MSSFNATRKDAELVVSPYEYFCKSICSQLYDMDEVDNLVYIGMCELYGNVIPEENILLTDEMYQKMIEEGIQPEAHMPCRTPITDSSKPGLTVSVEKSEGYKYTSKYKHNIFEVQIMESQKGTPEQHVVVEFTIMPKHISEDGNEECKKIESQVLDKIYTKFVDYFNFLQYEEWEQNEVIDEHSYRINDDL